MKTATAPLPPLRSVKVLDQLREHIHATCITAYQPNRLMSTGFVPSSVFHGVRHPATLGSSEVEAFLSGWRTSAGFGLHASSGIGGLAVLLRQVLCTDLPWQEIGRPRPSRRLPVVLTPDEVVRILGFFWKASIVCSPSFCMERACGSVRVCNCGSGSGFRSRHDHRAGGQGLKGSGLDVTRAWHPACASSCRVHGHGG